MARENGNAVHIFGSASYIYDTNSTYAGNKNERSLGMGGAIAAGEDVLFNQINSLYCFIFHYNDKIKVGLLCSINLFCPTTTMDSEEL